jgi:hypothetical protein
MNKPPVYSPKTATRKLVQGHGVVQAMPHGAAPPVYRPVPGLAPAWNAAALQRKVGPPPAAHAAMNGFAASQGLQIPQRSGHAPDIASGPVAGRRVGFISVVSHKAVQREASPPPMASEILQALKTPRSGMVQCKPMVPVPQGNGFRHGGPLRPPAPRHTAQRPRPGARTAGSVQLFKVKTEDGRQKEYNNKLKVQPLITQIQAAGTFMGKDDNVKYWLEQYVTMYPKKTFEAEELQDYLYDDIVRENKPITGDFEMSAQELLTTEAGLARLRNRVQARPPDTPLRFYRSMSLTELKSLLIKDPANPGEAVGLPQVGRQLVGRLNPDELGRHLGDYKQAKSYYNGTGPQALLEFTVKSSTDFFKSDKLALPTSKKIFDETLRGMFGGGHTVANAAEGLNDTLPGLKSEKRGVYSVSLTKPAAKVFLDQVTSVKVIMIKGA